MTKQISITWTDADVIHQAEDIGETLTEQEVSDILELMEKDHDATIGINWDVISFYIDKVIEERA